MESPNNIYISEQTLSRLLTWISAADQKAGPVLAIDTAMLAVIAALVPSSHSWPILAAIAASLTSSALLFSIACLALATFPRTQGPKGSMIYFGGIIANGEPEFIKKISNITSSEYLDDLAKQCYRNAQIANTKYTFIRFALISLFRCSVAMARSHKSSVFSKIAIGQTMKSNPTTYSYLDSVTRIDEILEGADASYEEVDSIPSRDRLTFSNGFYVNCSALFIDLRGSSSLAEKYKRPTLAKIYRSYVSECVAVINGYTNCAEVMIEGDGVAGIFDTPYKSDIDGTFAVGYQLQSLVHILNCRFKPYNIDPVKVGIGMSWGRALMIKAGHKGSSISETVWLGDVVNEAAKLCKNGSRTYMDHPIMVSSNFYGNLNDHNKGLLSWNANRSCYHGNVVAREMNDWVKQNCQ